MYSSISGIKNTHRKNVYNYANVDFPKEAIEEMFAKLHKISKDVSRLAPNRAVRGQYWIAKPGWICRGTQTTYHW